MLRYRVRTLKRKIVSAGPMDTAVPLHGEADEKSRRNRWDLYGDFTYAQGNCGSNYRATGSRLLPSGIKRLRR